MEVNNISVNTQSSIKIELDKTIYFDPYEIKKASHDADIIFITHDHYDHFDISSLECVKNKNTIVVVPLSMKETISKVSFKEYIYLSPFEEINIEGLNVKAIPAYNLNKNFHPRENNWLGYLIEYKGIKYYIAGDTDITDENSEVKCDIAFLPCGGTYTMEYGEASTLARRRNPSVVIPIHYGSIVGTKEDGLNLKMLLKDASIEVIEKLVF